MKIYILTDLEGVSGVARWDQTGADTPGYPQAVRLMTEELRACIEGIQQTDPQAEIWVWDAHGCGSIDFERFPRGAKLINNMRLKPPSFLDSSFDALFFLGQHAKAGTLNGNLAHSYSSRNIEYIKINGLELGEFGCRAALAGSYGVPTVFISGDDKAIAEARELVPNIYGAQVKIGLGPQVALHLAPEDARDLIRQVAAEATAHIHEIEPFVIPGPPYKQEIKIWARTDPVDYLLRGFQQIDARTFIKEADRLEDLLI
ncbi:MAG: M55 family metallopeptidase [Anaerolineae bacterium]|nr:M55 family metallopeptidase [Anaerolineae bacterium]